MKIKLTIIALAISACAMAQKDPCKDIKKVEDEFEKITTFSTPRQSSLKTSIVLYRYLTKEGTIDQVGVSFVSDSRDYSNKDTFLKFEDGTIFKAVTSSADCKYIGSNQYAYVSTFDIDDEIIKKISKLKIVKVKIGKEEKGVQDNISEKILSYSKCIWPLDY